MIEVLILSRQTSYERDDRGDPGCEAEAAGLRAALGQKHRESVRVLDPPLHSPPQQAGGWHWRPASAGSQLTFTRQSSNRDTDREDPEPCLPLQRPPVGTGSRARRPARPPDGASSFYVLPLPEQCASRAFLDRVISADGPIVPPVRGNTPFRYRERTCARARGGVRWGPMVNALGFQGMCYRVIGHLRARHVLGKTPFLDEVTRASLGYESTWKFRPPQQKPSNKWFRRNVLPGMDLGPFIGAIVGHLEGRFQRLPGVWFCA